MAGENFNEIGDLRSMRESLTTLAGSSVAHDSVDSGSPLKIGGVAIATATQQALVAAGDRVNAVFNRAGALHVSAGLVTGPEANAAQPFLVFPEADNGSWYPLAAGMMVFNGAGMSVVPGDATDGMMVQSNAIGTVADAAWDGVAANATVISLLKAIALNTTT